MIAQKITRQIFKLTFTSLRIRKYNQKVHVKLKLAE